MRAAIIEAPYKMEIGPWQTPRLGPSDVLVAVRAAGICAADMYFYVGKIPYGTYPQVCGHEVAGVVAEIGSDVQGFKPGDRVVVEPFIACGTCYPCRIGRSNCCARLEIIGVHRAGGYAEYLRVPANNIHLIPEDLSFSLAAFAEPVAIGIQVCHRGQVFAGDSVLVLGCGPIGLAIIEVAKSRGASVAATDILPSRLEVAARLDVRTFPASEDSSELMMEYTRGEGFPVVIEATGNPRAMEQSVDLVAGGGRIVIAGVVKQGTEVTLPGLDFTRKELTILGSRASVNCFPESLRLLASGGITYPRVATEFSLWEAPRVFAHLAEHPGAVHKGILVYE